MILLTCLDLHQLITPTICIEAKSSVLIFFFFIAAIYFNLTYSVLFEVAQYA